MNRVNKKTIFIIILIGFIVHFSYKFYNAIKEDSETVNKVISKEYLSLFNPICASKLKVICTFESKTRQPMTNLVFDNKYSIVLIKLIPRTELNLSKCINIYKSNNIRQGTEVYRENNRYYYLLSCKSGQQDTITNIFIGYDGDSLSYLVKNDSFVSLRIHANKYLIKYDKNLSAEYILDSENNKMKNVPQSLLFFYRNKQLYVVFLCAMGNIEDDDINIIDKLFLF